VRRGKIDPSAILSQAPKISPRREARQNRSERDAVPGTKDFAAHMMQCRILRPISDSRTAGTFGFTPMS
jgi:hypothetical protein